MKKLIYLLLALVLFSCTENQRARTFGGTIKVELPKNKRLITATWKETHLWYLTEDMPKGYEPSKKYFKEDSNYGIIEGEVVFIESRDDMIFEVDTMDVSDFNKSPWNNKK